MDNIAIGRTSSDDVVFTPTVRTDGSLEIAQDRVIQ